MVVTPKEKVTSRVARVGHPHPHMLVPIAVALILHGLARADRAGRRRHLDAHAGQVMAAVHKRVEHDRRTVFTVCAWSA